MHASGMTASTSSASSRLLQLSPGAGLTPLPRRSAFTTRHPAGGTPSYNLSYTQSHHKAPSYTDSSLIRQPIFHPLHLHLHYDSISPPLFHFPAAVRAQAAAATTRSNVGEVTNVGLKDVPLRSLFPEEPGAPKAGAPKLKVAIVGSGLAGLSTAVELLDQGYEVDIYESRPFIGGKVASFQDKDGNHIEMGLHVFFGCYFNLFRLMAKCGVLENLLLKEHTHTFCNAGGDVRELDFRFYIGDTKIGAPFHGRSSLLLLPFC